MKITIWVRVDELGRPTCRTDCRCESRDTPMVWNLGHALVEAVRRGEVGPAKKAEGDGGR